MYYESPAPPPLEPYLECFWCSDGSGTKLIPPDGCVDIVLRPELGTVQVIGLMTRAQTITVTGKSFGARFRPGGARPFLNLPLHTLTDLQVSLDQFWERSRIGPLLESRHPLLTLERMLLEARPLELPDPRVDFAINLLWGGASVEYASSELGLSRQQLTRIFKNTTGTGPQAIMRILRMRRLLKALREHPNRSRCQLALEFGFHDQSHMLLEARKLLGSVRALYWDAKRNFSGVLPKRCGN